MICRNCGEREATVLVQTVVNNQVSKTALCGRCAAEVEPAAALNAVLEALAALGGRARTHPGRCPTCRSSFADFRETGLFGCPDCYERFRTQVQDLLPRVHGGAYEHRGKVPRGR
ncbi:MAG: hypothetical protein HY552_00375 [Elusimicrobia bacterium]|nr:hypothetical protein [Elusimicrobiota bacterium]